MRTNRSTTTKEIANNEEVQVEGFEEDVENVERFGEYGIASKPPINSEGVTISIRGNDNECILFSLGG